MKHTIREEISGVLIVIGAVWAVFVADWVLPVDLNAFGVTPRSLPGLVGIPVMPLLHANLQHLISNTVPLFVLLTLLAGSRANSWQVVAVIVALSGGLLWVFGRHATHVGASGLIFGLITFLLVSGILEQRLVPLLIGLLVGALYGGTLLTGVIPRLGSTVSWDGHLCGAAAGVIVAYTLTRRNNRHRRSDNEGGAGTGDLPSTFSLDDE